MEIDDIVKSLVCCGTRKTCEDCPVYDEELFAEDDFTRCHGLMTTAAELIKSLQANLTAAVGDIMHECDLCLHETKGWDDEPCAACCEGHGESKIKRPDNWQWRGQQAGKEKADAQAGIIK